MKTMLVVQHERRVRQPVSAETRAEIAAWCDRKEAQGFTLDLKITERHMTATAVRRAQ